MKIDPVRTHIFSQGEILTDFVDRYVPHFNEGDILVITSKIVSLAQNRVVAHDAIDIIKNESDESIQTPWATLTRHGAEWKINAGIDESNAQNQRILLPRDPHKVARDISRHLQKKHIIKKCGVIISDTRSTPLRKGTIGRAIGFYGIQPLRSYIGKKDLFGRKSRVTESNVVDALACAAVLEMGEGNEQIPLVLIHEARVTFTMKSLTKKERGLSIAPENDIFLYVFNHVSALLKKSSRTLHRQK